MGAGASSWNNEELARSLEKRDDKLAFFAFDVRESNIDGVTLFDHSDDDAAQDLLVQKLTRSGGPVEPALMESLVHLMNEVHGATKGTMAHNVDNNTFRAEGDGDEIAQSPSSECHSTKLGRCSDGSRFLTLVGRGMMSAVNVNELETGESDGASTKYEAGTAIAHGDKPFCTILRRLGAGTMGVVYLVERGGHEGGRFALKTVRPTASARETVELEKAFATELALAFATGTSPLIASVVDALIPAPGVETSAKGLLIMCDLIESGDLEQAMHSGAKNRNGDLIKDYSGKLYNDQGAEVWPLASVILQIFAGLKHIHGRGIIHQVIGWRTTSTGKFVCEREN